MFGSRDRIVDSRLATSDHNDFLPLQTLASVNVQEW